MDERLQNALDFSNYMATINSQKRILKQQFKETAVYYYNGGQFAATPHLIGFVNTLIQNNVASSAILDVNDLPIMIEDLTTFLKNIIETYILAVNDYYQEYENLRKNRSVEGLVGL